MIVHDLMETIRLCLLGVVYGTLAGLVARPVLRRRGQR